MKNLSFLSYKAGLAFMISCFTLLVVLSSCTKDNDIEPVPVGEVRIQFVNAFQGSDPQDFYVDEARLGTQSVAYGQSSGYITSSSDKTSFYFKDPDTTAINAGTNGGLQIGGNYTFYYFRSSTNTKTIAPLEEDLTAPASGKARVRFLHLNSYMANTVPLTISAQGGAALENNFVFGQVSQTYKEVDPNTIISISANGLTTPFLINANIAAGKIYTIWIGGTSAVNLTGNVILHN